MAHGKEINCAEVTCDNFSVIEVRNSVTGQSSTTTVCQLIVPNAKQRVTQEAKRKAYKGQNVATLKKCVQNKYFCNKATLIDDVLSTEARRNFKIWNSLAA